MSLETETLAGMIDPSTSEHDAYATMTNHALKMERQRNELRDAIRTVIKSKGRYNTQKAMENLIKLLPEKVTNVEKKQ